MSTSAKFILAVTLIVIIVTGVYIVAEALGIQQPIVFIMNMIIGWVLMEQLLIYLNIK